MKTCFFILMFIFCPTSFSQSITQPALLPTSEEIKVALDQIWLTEKTQTIKNLVENRKKNPSYAPSPGYSLPKSDSDKEHQKRLSNLRNLPDRPFSQSTLKVEQCTEMQPNPKMVDFRTKYLCTINIDDLKKIFPSFKNPKTTQYIVEAIYHNNQWIIGFSNFDPLLSTFQHLDYYDGCLTPLYRPKEWNEPN